MKRLISARKMRAGRPIVAEIPKAFSLLALLLAASNAAAQNSATDNLPSSFEPANQRPVPAVSIARDPGVAPPPGSESLFILIGNVKIEGALPEMAEANQAFRDQLIGKRIAVSDLFRATGALEVAYANSGYVLSRVVLPQQQVVDGGSLRVVVVDGFIESIDATRVPGPVRNRIIVMTDGLINKRKLKRRDLERALLLAGDTYGVALGSTLNRGGLPGGVVMVLDGEYQRVTGSYGFDNSISGDLGTVALNGGLELNGALGMGETFYGRVGGSPRNFLGTNPQNRILAAGSVFPIGQTGLTFNVEATSSRTTPTDQLVPTNSAFDRLSLRLYYPWIRSRNFNLSSQFILDRQSDQQNLLINGQETPIYNDELSVFRATLAANRNFENATALSADMIFSQGVDAFGAQRANSGATPMSRQGADAVFSKLVLGVGYQKPLNNGFNISVNAKMQSGFGDALPSSEQFNAIGGQQLSSFDSGAIKGDSGFVARAEVSRSSPVALKGFPIVLSPYLFATYGVVGLENPTIVEQGTTKASAFGIGHDLFTNDNSPFGSGSVRLELGWGSRDDNIPAGSRFNIVASRRF